MVRVLGPGADRGFRGKREGRAEDQGCPNRRGVGVGNSFCYAFLQHQGSVVPYTSADLFPRNCGCGGFA